MKYENNLIMDEGDILMLHGRFSGLVLPANWIVVDIVRIENGLLAEHPLVQFHFTPTYSSSLNQVELWFAKIQRDVVARGVFTSVADLGRKLCKYIGAYSKSAKPVRWTHTDPSRRITANKITATVY